MKTRILQFLLTAPMCLCLAAGGSVEKLKNEKVSAVEYTLRPGETVTLDAPHPVATVYFEGGTLEFTPPAAAVREARR